MDYKGYRLQAQSYEHQPRVAIVSGCGDASRPAAPRLPPIVEAEPVIERDVPHQEGNGRREDHWSNVDDQARDEADGGAGAPPV
jgi:hypothetical protein